MLQVTMFFILILNDIVFTKCLLSILGGSVGGLHKSMTRLSSSQQINQNASNSNNANSSKNIVSINNNNSSGNLLQSASVSPSNVPPVPPLSSNVIITGHNKWGIPSTKVTSGGVTVTTSPPRVRPLSQGPITLQGSSGALGKLSCSALNQSTGSIQQNSISVQHASPASPSFQNNQKSVMTLPLNPTNYLNNDVRFILLDAIKDSNKYSLCRRQIITMLAYPVPQQLHREEMITPVSQ